MLGPEGFGLFRLGLAAATVAGIIASGGVHTALLALIPRRSASHPAGGADALRGGLWYALVVATAVTVAGVLFHRPLSQILGEPEVAGVLAVLLVSVPFSAVLTASRAGARAVLAFPQAVLIGDVVRPGLFVCLLLGGLIAGRADVLTVSWMYTVSAVLAACVGLAVLARVPQFRGVFTRLRPAWDMEIAVLGMPMVFVEGLQALQESVMTFVLAVSSDATAVALYTAAQRTVGLVAMVWIAVNSAVAPAIATLWTRGEYARLAEVVRQVTRWSLAASVMVVLVLIPSSRHVLQLFGDPFVQATPVLVLLTVGQLVNVGTGPVGYLLLLTGRHRLVVLDLAGVVGGTFVVGLWGARVGGITGAAVAAASGMAVVNLLMLHQVRSTLGFVPVGRGVLAVAGAGCVAAAAAAVAAAVAGGMPALPRVAGSALVAVAAYLVLLLRFSAPAERAALRIWCTRFRREAAVP
jgi:O-antigen/teichoic acid export membrane protein